MMSTIGRHVPKLKYLARKPLDIKRALIMPLFPHTKEAKWVLVGPPLVGFCATRHAKNFPDVFLLPE